ncbi:MAG TPA: DUF2283 domain-containing protein [Pseudonocardia sp.]|uniref:DUF2283 domain-containing protein n=1 Tax=Pseudonocardia sp. TaxID=60912 RepID=UPI002CB595ED|nr:DUF2283 domain-containing protein [Pseudonocardia sp.]HTF47549.1 DUF2283 domain-containing protein [Pseudonocardia sp.]
MTLSWDAESDAGYIQTGERGQGNAVARSIPIQDQESRIYGAIDLADDGTLLGIEILGVSKMFPGTSE